MEQTKIYEAERGYTDVTLNRHVDKGEILDKIYAEAGVELTEERIKYLVEKRKLYIPVEESEEEEEKTETETDEGNEEETAAKSTTKSRTKNTKKNEEK